MITILGSDILPTLKLPKLIGIPDEIELLICDNLLLILLTDILGLFELFGTLIFQFIVKDGVPPLSVEFLFLFRPPVCVVVNTRVTADGSTPIDNAIELAIVSLALSGTTPLKFKSKLVVSTISFTTIWDTSSSSTIADILTGCSISVGVEESAVRVGTTVACVPVTAACVPVTAACVPVTAACVPVIPACVPVTAVCVPVTAACVPVTAACVPVTAVCVPVISDDTTLRTDTLSDDIPKLSAKPSITDCWLLFHWFIVIFKLVFNSILVVVTVGCVVVTIGCVVVTVGCVVVTVGCIVVTVGCVVVMVGCVVVTVGCVVVTVGCVVVMVDCVVVTVGCVFVTVGCVVVTVGCVVVMVGCVVVMVGCVVVIVGCVVVIVDWAANELIDA